MARKLSADQLLLYEGIDEILWQDWDPIGVRNHAPRDEYHRYVPQVFKLALENATPLEIAEYLHQVAAEEMGLSSCIPYHLAVAEKIRRLKLELIPEIN